MKSQPFSSLHYLLNISDKVLNVPFVCVRNGYTDAILHQFDTHCTLNVNAKKGKRERARERERLINEQKRTKV